MATLHPAASKSRLAVGLVCVIAGVGAAAPASAKSRPRHAAPVGVSYQHFSSHGRGHQTLLSDGPGTGFGFYRLPGEIRFAAAVHRERQSYALRSTVITDALTQGGPYGFGLHDSVYGYGNRASYGVFSGADGYGSPYFAGYYGPGNGADLGPLGHTYE